MARVKGKVALITGAASGIGAAVARLLAREGAAVILTDIDAGAGREVAAGIGSAASFLVHDVVDELQWQRVMTETRHRHGRLDVLVNCAGIALFNTIEDTTLEEWRRVLAVNLDGVFLGCQYAIKTMIPGGGGSIINLSSVSGLVGGHNLAAYNASKGGVRLLTKSIALHCARQGYNIRCNSVHPTFVDTPMVRKLIDASPDPAKLEAAFKRQIPLGRLAQAEEIAQLVLYLASDDSAFVTGAELVIDGGVTAQ
ncbi:MAG: glucose 1-dehydrogenase [Gammaproteobacteria bacterium]